MDVATGAPVGMGLAALITAAAVDDGLTTPTGRSIPPRSSTNPNEIAALIARMMSATRVARGTAGVRPEVGRAAATTAGRGYRGQSA